MNRMSDEHSSSPEPAQLSANVAVEAAKGRPMLTWVGKRPLRYVTPLPAQLVEAYGPHSPSPSPERRGGEEVPPPGRLDSRADLLPLSSEERGLGGEVNLLFHADNKDMLAHLLANGFRSRIKLIYIDPPFDSAADYVRKVTLRGRTAIPALRGEVYTLGEQVQYTDIWARDNYLQFMYERLLLLRELLAEDGSLWLHCDHRRVHYLRLLLEEVFGPDNFLNTISWRSQVARGAKVNAFYFPFSTHYLEIFAKNREFPTTWNPVKKQIVLSEAEAASEYMRDERGFFRTSDPGSYSYERLKVLHAEGRLYAPFGGQVVVDEAARRVVASNGGNIGVKYYLKPAKNGTYVAERAVDNLWDDIPGLGTTPGEDSGYPTQKTEALLRRIITVSSNPGDWVLDCFTGSGTTLAVAQKLGRRWIGGDINRGAIQTTVRRLAGLAGQTHSAGRGEHEPKPVGAQDGFVVLRINDYDLPLQHNEAVALACEHIGIQRSRDDAFFDGSLGQRLVKIVPFGQPLGVQDLEAIRGELAARPDEARDVVVVCLGKHLAADAWLEQWNRFRRAEGMPNRIEVIELRTDARYGRFFEHRPAQARVSVCRDAAGASPGASPVIRVIVEDFISPAVVERLRQAGHGAAPRLDDWRVMVDSIMIDPAYDGVVFRPACVDAPRKKAEVVLGRYELPGAEGETVVAVKLTDVLGEEVLVVERV